MSAGVRGYIVELEAGVYACGRHATTVVRDGATFYFSHRRAQRTIDDHRHRQTWPLARVVPVVVRLIPVDERPAGAVP